MLEPEQGQFEVGYFAADTERTGVSFAWVIDPDKVLLSGCRVFE